MGQATSVAFPREQQTSRRSNAVLLTVALVGAATPVLVAAFDRNRLWHEGVDGFFVAVVACVMLVVRAEPGSWPHQIAKALLVLAGVTVFIVVILLVFLVIAIEKNGFTF